MRFTFKNFELTKNDRLTAYLKELSIFDFYSFLIFIENMPYGRIQDKCNPLSVVIERKGTCSTKHILIAHLLSNYSMKDWELKAGIFYINVEDFTYLSSILNSNQLQKIPEAHCYLTYKNEVFDFTLPYPNLFFPNQKPLKEIRLPIQDPAEQKLVFHQQYIKEWLIDNKLSISFKNLWDIREQCIEKISEEMQMNRS